MIVKDLSCPGFLKPALLSALLHVLCCGALYGERVEWKQELSSQGEWRNRFVVSEGDITYLAIGTGSPSGTGICRLGIDSPPLTIGSLSPAGLLREIRSPLGYGVGSTVFREKTALKVDGSCSGSGETGLRFGWDALSLFVFDREGLRQTGVLVGCGPEKTMDFVFSTSHPDKHYENSGWYGGMSGFPGGRIVQNAIRVRRSYSQTNIGLTACASGGAFAPAGFFTCLRAERGGRNVEAGICTGFCTRNYLNPLGERGRRRFVAGWDISFGGPPGEGGPDNRSALDPSVGCTFGLGYYGQWNQPDDWLNGVPAVPGESRAADKTRGTGLFLPGKEKMHMRAGLAEYRAGAEVFSFRPALEMVYERDSEGEIDETANFQLEGSLNLVSVSVDWVFRLSTDPFVKADIEFRRDPWDVSVRIEEELLYPGDPDLRLRVCADVSTFRIYGETRIEDGAGEVIFGWEVRSAR